MKTSVKAEDRTRKKGMIQTMLKKRSEKTNQYKVGEE